MQLRCYPPVVVCAVEIVEFPEYCVLGSTMSHIGSIEFRSDICLELNSSSKLGLVSLAIIVWDSNWGVCSNVSVDAFLSWRPSLQSEIRPSGSRNPCQ